MPAKTRPAFRLEVDWADNGDPFAVWSDSAAYPPVNLAERLVSWSGTVGARTVGDLSVPDLSFGGRFSGTANFSNTDDAYTVGVPGRAATYDPALTSRHLFRFVADTLVGRDVIQLGRCQLGGAFGGLASVDVTSRYVLLSDNPSVASDVPDGTQAGVAARRCVDQAAAASGLPTVPVSAFLEPEDGGGVSSVVVTGAAGDQNSATLSALLSQWANVLCGWWQERWDGSLELLTFVRQNDSAVYATIDSDWLVDADRSRAGKVWGMVRNQAETRGPTSGTRTESVSRIYRLSQVLSGVSPTEIVRWTPGDTTVGAITGVTGWQSVPEFVILVDDAHYTTWDPHDSDEWDYGQTVSTGAGFSRQTLTEVSMLNATWNQIRADYMTDFGTDLSASRVDVDVQFRPRVTRNAIGDATIPAATDMSAEAVALRESQQAYGIRAMPVTADTVSTTATFTNGALALETLTAMDQPRTAATLVIPMNYATDLTVAPHTLRLGDRTNVLLSGIAEIQGQIVGLGWDWRAEQEPLLTAVVYETGVGPPPVAPAQMAAPLTTSPDDGIITVGWTPSTAVGLLHYQVRYSTDAGVVWTQHHLNVPSADDAVTLSGLDAGTYIFQVRAVVGGGLAGEWSPSSDPPLTIDATGIPPVENLTIDSVTDSIFTASWDATTWADFDHYRYQRRLNNTGAWQTSTTTQTSINVAHNGSGGDVVNLRVRVEEADDSPGPWATANGMVPVPPASQTLTIGAGSFVSVGGNLYLRWQPPTERLIETQLVDGGGTAYLRELRLSLQNNGASHFYLSETDSGGGADTAPDMISDWETNASAMTIEAGSLSLTVPGPANTGNDTPDTGNRYNWFPADAQATLNNTFRQAYTALTQAERDATTLTLSVS